MSRLTVWLDILYTSDPTQRILVAQTILIILLYSPLILNKLHFIINFSLLLNLSFEALYIDTQAKTDRYQNVSSSFFYHPFKFKAFSLLFCYNNQIFYD